ncbi:MAG: trypsin-like peptidase domain-containing protein [Oscillospiraceae bacterium]|nr:trypsin-like peptidase domain-containing protein [Oscillospiraceae bacterium]
MAENNSLFGGHRQRPFRKRRETGSGRLEDPGSRMRPEENRPPWEIPPRRRLSSGGFALLVFAVLILGAAFFTRAIHFSTGSGGSFSTRPPLSTPEATQKSAGLLLQRAPTNPDVTLNLSALAGDKQTYQQIYTKSIPSVVGVEGSKYTGTGIIISSDGYIITNYHVVAGNSKVEICLQNQSKYEARLVGGDKQNDLVVLKIEAKGLTPAEFGNSSSLRVGDRVLAIGNPLGIELRDTMTDGIISAINRDVIVDGRIMTLIQTNAALNAGNSGGPLLNESGQVVGINTMKMSSYDSSVEGLGFAIPITSAKPVIDQLLAKGAVLGSPALGVTVAAVDGLETAAPDLPQGLYVLSVHQKSDAYQKGLRPGDVIVSCNGKAVVAASQLNLSKSGLKVGDTVQLKIYRGGTYQTYFVTLMDRSKLEEE